MVHTENVYNYLKEDTLYISSSQLFEADKKLEIKKYQDCYALPYKFHETNGIPNNAGGLDVNGTILKNSACSGWAVGYPYEKKDAIEITKEVIYIGFICDYCWGHTITDSLEHLWWFRTNEYKEHYYKCDIYYWSQKPLAGVFLEILEKAGVPLEKLHHVDKVLHFESAIVPDSSIVRISFHQLSYTKEYVKTVDDIIKRKNSRLTIDKFFIIRKNDSRQHTSKRIKKILISKGFKEFVPTNHTLSDQISAFYNAKEIVCEESSASHNFIFCKPGTKVTLLRKCNYVNEYQALVNSMRNLDVTYIDCHLSVVAYKKLPSAGPFFLYANQSFCRVFDVDYKMFPFEELKKNINYFLYHQSCGRYFSSIYNWDSNYVRIFTEELEIYRKRLEYKIRIINFIPFIGVKIKQRLKTAILKRAFKVL